MKLLEPVFRPFFDDSPAIPRSTAPSPAWFRLEMMKNNRSTDEHEPFWRWFFD